jgi:hypothetical protein
MAIRIDSKIIDYEVAQADTGAGKPKEPEQAIPVEEMHEKLQRPEVLEGSTYKIKTQGSEHALYVTINDLVLNPGSDQEVRRPFEVFINSKNMDHFQWIVALTRIMSAVFRKGGDCTFLVEEMHSVFDPRGGYFKRGGRWMPSLVAEIGDVLNQHLRKIGMIRDEVDEYQQAYLEQKRREFENQRPQGQMAADCDDSSAGFPPGSVLCNKCHTLAMIQMDGCLTCLNCGESKCG